MEGTPCSREEAPPLEEKDLPRQGGETGDVDDLIFPASGLPIPSQR